MTKKTLLDAVGTTGGKVTVETATYINKAGHLKPWKSGPKQYKKGPGPTGKDRLQRSVNSLLQAASRLERKATEQDDVDWARRLREALMAFNNPASDYLPDTSDIGKILRAAKEAWVCPYCARSYDQTLMDWEREAADHLDACKRVEPR